MINRKRILKISSITIFILLFFAGTYFVILEIAPIPPVEEIEGARIAMSDAWKKGANVYTPRMMKQAQALYDTAMSLWKSENARFLLFRDYDEVRKKSIESRLIAMEAAGFTQKTSENLKDVGKVIIIELRLRVTNSGPLFNRLPLPQNVRKKNTQGKLLLGEAENAYNNGDYIKAKSLLSEAKGLLEDSFDHADKFITEYFEAYPQWNKWVKNTIADSKKNRNIAIIVDKFDRKCYIYKSGVLKHTFIAELGKNWIGHKKVKGDNSTPEGCYKIVAKKDNRHTIYYKALLINYPNIDDKDAFYREKNKGNIPSNSALGSLIEIHGQGGKGGDWTKGCVALTDKDMDVIYKLSSVGTPITIVGSLKDLVEILNR